MVLISITLFIVLSAVIDYEHLKDNDYIESHTSRWLLRALFVLAVAKGNIAELLGMTFLFMAIFDSLLNKLRGLDLFYLGTVALWDRFWSKIMPLFIVFKIVCLFVGTYLLLI